jgi:thiol peroxidase
MAKITLKGNPFNTNGELPKVGESIPAFTLTNADLENVTLETYAGNKLILNCFPSVDTPVCANSVKSFNEKAVSLPGVKVLCISKDLPFAQKKILWCRRH